MERRTKIELNKIFVYALILFTIIVGLFIVVKDSTRSSLGADNQSIDLNVNLEKYINYKISNEDRGTLVEYDIKANLKNQTEEEKYVPLKQTQLKLEFNKIDEKYPFDVKIIAKETKMTNGKTKDIIENYEYDSEKGIVIINANNVKENGELINSVKPEGEISDEYLIITYYDTYVQSSDNRKLNIKVEANAILNEENRLIKNEVELNNDVSENIGDLTSITKTTQDIYNSYIKSNIINGTEYGTQYIELENIDISKKEAQENIKLIENNTFVKISQDENGQEIENDLGNNAQLLYKSTKVNKEDIEKILGEEGKIEILDNENNVIATVDKNTQYSENGFFTINYENGIEKFIVKTSKIENEGILRFEHKKEIKNTAREVIDAKIKTISQLIGIKQEKIEEKTIDVQTFYKEYKSIIDIKEAKSNVSLELSSQNLTNKEQNELTFNIYINSNTIKDNMLKNPSMRIELPEQVEKVILQSSSALYTNGLELQEPYLETNENGNIVIVANLLGVQNNYDENQLGLVTNIRIPATVILKKDIENTLEKVKFTYINNYTLDGNPEIINNEYDLEISSYEKQIPVNQDITLENNDEKQISEVDGLKLEVIPIKGDTVLKEGDIVYEGEFIKYNIKVTNTSDKKIDNIKIVGTIPEGTTYGELKADYYNPLDTVNGLGEYKYNYKEDMNQNEINISALESNKSEIVFYEVKANDLENNSDSKKILTNIKVFVNNIQAMDYNISNFIEKAEVKLFLDASPTSIRNEWIYHLNVISDEEKLVNIKIKFPDSMKDLHMVNPEHHMKDGEKIPYDVNITDNNLLTTKVTANKEGRIYSFQGNISNSKLESIMENHQVELISNAVAYYDNKEYRSNENRIIHEYADVTISMSSKNEGEEIRYDDEINYEIIIKNEGKTNLKFSFTNPEDGTREEYQYLEQVNLKDYLPTNLKLKNVEYDNWELEKLDYNEEENTYTYGNEFKKVSETRDISDEYIDEKGNKLPNIDLDLNIPSGESAKVKINARAGMVYEKTKIENMATIMGENFKTKTSNTISHTILPYDYIEKSNNQEDSNNSNNSNNSNDPKKDENRQNNNEKYSISGVVWLDLNKDGQRQVSEELLNNVQIILINTNNSNAIQQKITTNDSGEYKFSDLEKGNYIVVFNYDTNAYSLTEYQKMGIPSSLNSDAMDKEITLLGNKTKVGITDIIALDASEKNIDIGLIKNKVCDLKLDKYISKVTVSTNGGIKEQTYNQSQLAKVEIRSKEIQGAMVVVEYKIVITNEGEIPTSASKIIDYIPNGLQFSSELNNDWTINRKGELINTSLANKKIESGKSVELTLVLTKSMTSNSTGTFTNAAEIGEISNSFEITDIDSNVANKAQSEDDYSKADLIISVSTGIITYISIITIILIVLGLIIFLNIKFGFKRITKITMIFIVSALTIFINTKNVLSYDSTDVLPKGNVYWSCNNPSNVPAQFYKSYNGKIFYAYCAYSGGPTGEFLSRKYVGIAKGSKNYSKTTSGDKNLTTDFKKENKDDDVLVVSKNNYYIVGPLEISGKSNNTYKYKIRTRDEKEKNKEYEAEPIDINGNIITNTSISTGKKTTVYLRIKINEIGKNESITSAIITASITGKKKEVTTVTGQAHYVPHGYDSPRYFSHYGYSTSNWSYNGSFEPWYGFYQDILTDKTYTETKEIESSENQTASNEEVWVIKNGDLEITKVDSDDTNVVLAGVKVRVYCQSTGYDQTFTTDKDGKIIIKDLRQGNYTVEELSNNYYGYSKLEKMTETLRPGMINEWKLKNEKQTGNLIIEKRDSDTKKNLSGVGFKIKRVDNSKYLKVKGLDIVEGQIYVDDTNIEDVENIKDATEFKTDNTGKILINNILTGSYEIEETSIKDYFAYDIDYKSTSWEYNTKKVENTENKVSIKVEITRRTSKDTVKKQNLEGTDINLNTINQEENADILICNNKKKYTKIKGYVFKDIGFGKNYKTNYLYKDEDADMQDNKISNVRVELHTFNSDNKEDKIIAVKNTDEQGEYLFENYTDDNGKIQKIEIDMLNKMYVQFIYNGMAYEATPIIKDDSEKIRDNSNNVKENEEDRKNFNKTFKEINGNSDLKYVKSNNVSRLKYTPNSEEDWTNPPVSDVYEKFQMNANTFNVDNGESILGLNMTLDEIRKKSEENDDTIKNINLGLMKREMPDISIRKDIENVELSINGYSHIYKYGAKKLDNYQIEKDQNGFNVGVKFVDYNNTYKRAVYESDYNYTVKYKDNNEKQKLNVYITYRISMYNTSSSLKVKVNNLVDYYDKNLTILDKCIGTSIDESNGQIIENNNLKVEQEEYEDNNFKRLIIQSDTEIEHEEMKSIYIKFKLGDNEVLKAFKDNNNENIEYKNIVEINSYSVFDKNNNIYAGIDVDSAPANLDEKEKLDTTKYEDDTDKAPGIKLEVTGDRTISGIVFLDESAVNEISNTRVGDGKYQEDEEHGIENVEVRLDEIENQNGEEKILETYYASQATDKEGKFLIKGFIPGRYKITYTWGDGTIYTLRPQNDNVEKEPIIVQDYKGTIVDEQRWKKNNSDENWYKEEETRYSDAIDDYNLREKIDKAQKDENGNQITKMNSTTPLMKFDYEITSVYSAVEDDKLDKFIPEDYQIENIDFGIVERAIQAVQMNKRVKNIQIILANNQPLIDTDVEYDPITKQYKFANENVKGITYIPESAGEPGKIKAELDNELIQGAKVNVTYAISLKNVSETDYALKEYYLYGIGGDESNRIKLELNGVYDYFDKEFSYDETNKDWKLETQENYTKDATILEKYYSENEELSDSVIENDYDRIINYLKEKGTGSDLRTLKLQDRKILKLEVNEELESGIEIPISSELKLSKVLATSDEIELKNDSEIANVIQKVGNSEKEEKLEGRKLSLTHSKIYTRSEDIIVTPPTGKKNNTTDIILITLSLLITVGTGIFFIKKKVLK